ncbi:ADP-ribosyl-(dinitrogen reductase) hydrolase [Stenotrophomonas maltophilia]|uniref:ADP-ribosyl-(dinitrogen reductase) hydrolase n=1 Tax=Stenotrophomonas maltophilia TaxID=40324 RepID=UPI0013D9CEB6|nr:ADP-ribosyl-(dinitrogen reductase) hydrolase [Stenotrophomonas maltophilia]
MDIKISRGVSEKLQNKHHVSYEEIREAFINRTGGFFTDSREDHQTNPPTYWFVGETDTGRTLKVVFVKYPDHYQIKSAYEPTDGSPALYDRLVRRAG